MADIRESGQGALEVAVSIDVSERDVVSDKLSHEKSVHSRDIDTLSILSASVNTFRESVGSGTGKIAATVLLAADDLEVAIGRNIGTLGTGGFALAASRSSRGLLS